MKTFALIVIIHITSILTIIGISIVMILMHRILDSYNIQNM